ATYNQLKTLAEEEFKKLIEEKDDRIQQLENMVNTALQKPNFYTEGDLNIASDRNVNIEKGNYNEKIKGNYLE
ncbi:MAG: pentapeptide repeat-containing protein, partial [Cyanobacteria bacterium P01_C01_bin.72]